MSACLRCVLCAERWKMEDEDVEHAAEQVLCVVADHKKKPLQLINWNCCH